eukprot:CAMPEP_0175452270 /NCGR_PEP_ID=MMETSP0095-20121207/63325_1 /TAXON_ID=311494 /ORGANISM="Alexandrium monilatum, Strain CCMP3105" /LENGTH=37 /DNA_ID= /DNA_START= /DNA_END= /DNA_ORIENTATION=
MAMSAIVSASSQMSPMTACGSLTKLTIFELFVVVLTP